MNDFINYYQKKISIDDFILYNIFLDGIFNIDDFYKEVKFEIGKTYTFKVNDLSNINDNSDETKDDYIQYIKDKNEITILINWMEVCSSDEDGIDCNVGFSFVN